MTARARDHGLGARAPRNDCRFLSRRRRDQRPIPPPRPGIARFTDSPLPRRHSYFTHLWSGRRKTPHACTRDQPIIAPSRHPPTRLHFLYANVNMLIAGALAPPGRILSRALMRPRITCRTDAAASALTPRLTRIRELPCAYELNTNYNELKLHSLLQFAQNASSKESDNIRGTASRMTPANHF
jgi:hypothetical protein